MVYVNKLWKKTTVRQKPNKKCSVKNFWFN